MRELISNASDAIDKLYFKSLTDHSVTTKKEDYKIFLALDKDSRTITLTDNGIGMSKEELERTWAPLPAAAALISRPKTRPRTLISSGQFGVGFYSAFMVASRVTVISRAFGSEGGLEVGVEGRRGLHDHRDGKDRARYPDHPGGKREHRKRELRRIFG